MLQATGTVLLNGTRTPQSMSVFSGDRIDTAEAAAVSINRTGLSVVMNSNSSVRYQDDGFAILKGTARVRTSKGMTAHAGPVSVIPKGDSALFDISSDGKTALVTSREGGLTLTDGVEMASLAPGYTAKIALDLSQDQDQSQNPNPAAQGQGGEGGFCSNRKRCILWIFLAAAAAAGITCAVTCGGGGPTPVTPVVP
jgi:hypothetical protein